MMQKITSILGVVQDAGSDATVLDKCVALARTFHARLVLLVRDASQAAACTAHCDMRGLAGVETVSAGDGSPADAIIERVESRSADLVVKRLSTGDTRRFWLSPGDHSLVESCPAPLLLVRERPWSPELRFAAAVDVADRASESLARGILQAGGFLALGLEAWLDVLYSEREQADPTLRMERAVRLARLVREFHVGGERLQVFDGAPEKTLPALVRARQYDVLVAGAVSRRNTLRSAFGTLTSALVDATAGDVLLVKTDVRAAAPARHPSAGEQLAYQL